MVGVSSTQVKESLNNLAQRLRQAETPISKEQLQVCALTETGQSAEYQCDR